MTGNNSTDPTRNLPSSGVLAGSVFLPQLVNTVNEHSKSLGGNASNVSGTNTYKFTINTIEGLANHGDSMVVNVIIPNTNTGAVTFEIQNASGTSLGLGAKSVLLRNQDQMTGGELSQDVLYTFAFISSIDAWVLVSEPSVTSLLDSESIGAKPYLFARSFLAGSHTFITPFRCVMRVRCFGAGGGGYYYGSSGAAYVGSGGAGGSSVKEFIINSSVSVQLSVGSAIVYDDGGNSTAIASNINSNGDALAITASGGSAGDGSSAGDGGSASGGDYNFSGGDGRYTLHQASGGIIGIDEDGVNGSAYSTPLPANFYQKMEQKYPNITIPPFEKLDIFDQTNLGTRGFGAGGNGGSSNAGGSGQQLAGSGLITIEYSGDLDA